MQTMFRKCFTMQIILLLYTHANEIERFKKMEMQVNVEIIDGDKYYTAQDAKGNTTMIFVWDGQMYIQTNNTPPRCIEDVKRLSKTAKALIEYVSAISEEEEIGNPRYAAFAKAHGKQPNHVYLAFINDMKIRYCGDLYGHISNHDDFTSFIDSNAHKFQPLDDSEGVGYGHPSLGL